MTANFGGTVYSRDNARDILAEFSAGAFCWTKNVKIIPFNFTQYKCERNANENHAANEITYSTFRFERVRCDNVHTYKRDICYVLLLCGRWLTLSIDWGPRQKVYETHAGGCLMNGPRKLCLSRMLRETMTGWDGAIELCCVYQKGVLLV